MAGLLLLLFYTFLLSHLLLLSIVSANDAPHVCVWHDDESVFDLSPLTLDVGTGYVAASKDGGMPYYYNFCAPTALGGCEPNAAVCQVGAATYLCGKASDITFSRIDDGVRIKYGGGEGCSGGPRTTTINVHCDKNTTFLSGFASETSMCQYEINVFSKYGCPQSLNSIPSLPVNIFLVVHSHDDVGWLMTYDDYYTQRVHAIIENVITSISRTKSRKFIQVEQAYFARWWDVKQYDTKWNEMVRGLIANHQLSFTIGGWVMPDEATPSYTSMITQLTEGHQYLKRHFNFTPDVGWQIDPFGASSTMAEIYSETGFKGHVIDRINFMEKHELQSNKAMQFYWKYSKKEKRILTHILDSNYCWPFKSGLQAARHIPEDKLADYARLIVDTARLKARSLLTPNVMLPIGCDFTYTSPDETEAQYESLDRAIEYILAHKEELNVLNVQYSNVSDYFTALHESSAKFPMPDDKTDFFPYNDANNSWWTGYYTTAPTLKGLIRQSEATLRASELLYSTTLINGHEASEVRPRIDDLTRAISVNLHHDAITGTSNDAVVSNYHLLLNSALPPNTDFISATLSQLSTEWKTDSTLVFGASLTLSQVVPVVIYNSLPWIRHDYVKLILQNFDSTLSYSVTCSETKEEVSSQVVSLTEKNEHVLYFKVELPPVGYTTYFVSAKPGNGVSQREESKAENKLSNKNIKVGFSKTNAIDSVTFNSVSVPFQQSFQLYESFEGSDSQPSGAYVFRPLGEPYIVDQDKTVEANFRPGEFLSEVYQKLECTDSTESFVKQYVRLFHSDDEFLGNFVELTQVVGPLPKLGTGRELITRFTSPIATNVSYTDSNGLHFLRREYNSDLFLPIPGNYYPAVYASFIQHENSAIGFIFDRAHGFSNGFGRTDVMLHRRTRGDDHKGIQHGVDDDSVIEPVIRLVFGTPKDILRLIYKHIYLLNFPPVVTVGKSMENSEKRESEDVKLSYSLLARELPENVHLLDLKSANTSNPAEFIMRLTHLYDVDEHETLSEDVEVSLHDFFASPYCVTQVTETQLTAITAKHTLDMKGKNYSIVLKPKQIRTFVVEIKTAPNVCSGNPCGSGKCIQEGCSYKCECTPSFHFDTLSFSCLPDLATPSSLFHQLPLALLAHLTLVCGYSIRSELKKMEKKGGVERKVTKVEGKRGGQGKRFMQANKRMLERTFFPSSLPRHQD